MRRESVVATYLDRNGSQLDEGVAVKAAPNRYGIQVGSKGKVVRHVPRGYRVRVEFWTERGTEVRVMPPFMVVKA